MRLPRGSPLFLAAALTVAAIAVVAWSALSPDGAGGIRSTPVDVPQGDAEHGSRLLAEYGCGGCHVIPGVQGARGLVGPPLNRLGARVYIAGRLTNTPENLAAWIRHPQEIDPETAMPDLGVSEQNAWHMVAYLYTLD